MNAPLTFSSSTLTLRKTQLDFILLDASSSMTLGGIPNRWHSCLAAIDAYIAELEAQGIQSFGMLRTFSGHRGQLDYFSGAEGPIATWPKPLGSHIGMSSGGTPLYDAIAQMGLELREIDPLRCAVTICTDGEATGSLTTEIQARAILDWMRAKGWQVTFIGCDFDNSRIAGLLGANPQSAIGVQQYLLTDAARSLAKKRANYALSDAPMHWSTEEQQQFGGYLSHSGAKS